MDGVRCEFVVCKYCKVRGICGIMNEGKRRSSSELIPEMTELREELGFNLCVAPSPRTLGCSLISEGGENKERVKGKL